MNITQLDVEQALKVLRHFRQKARDEDRRSDAQRYSDTIGMLEDEEVPK